MKRGPLLVAAAASLWGLWSTCFKTAEAHSTVAVPAKLETFLVFAVMLVVTLPFAVRDARASPVRRTTTLWLLLLTLGVTDSIGCLCFFMALQKTTIAVAVLTHYTQPLLTALAAPMFVVDERWRPRTFVALGIAFAGLVLLLQPWRSVAPDDLEGALLGLGSAVLFAATMILGKLTSKHFSTAEVSSFPKLTSVVILGLAALPGGFAIEPVPLAVVVAGGAVLGAFSLVLFYQGLKATTASQAAVLTLCEPFVAVVVGALLWDQVPGPLAVLGAVFVLGGAALIALSPDPKRPP